MSELANHYIAKRNIYRCALLTKNIAIKVFFDFLKFIPFMAIILAIGYFAFYLFQSLGWYANFNDYCKAISIPFLVIVFTSFILESIRRIQKYLQNLKTQFALFYILIISVKEFLDIVNEIFDIPSDYSININKAGFLLDEDQEIEMEDKWKHFDSIKWDLAPEDIYCFNSNMELFNYALKKLNDEISSIFHLGIQSLDSSTINSMIYYNSNIRFLFHAFGYSNWKNISSYINPITSSIENAYSILYLLYKPWLIGVPKIDYWYSWYDFDILIH